MVYSASITVLPRVAVPFTTLAKAHDGSSHIKAINNI